MKFGENVANCWIGNFFQRYKQIPSIEDTFLSLPTYIRHLVSYENIKFEIHFLNIENLFR